MSLPLFYFETDELTPGGSVRLRGEEARHLSRSLRAREGERLIVGDGRGTLADARIINAGKSEVLARIDSVSLDAREVPKITLFQAVSKPSKMDETVARAAEAGIASVVPFVSERSGTLGTRAGERLSRWSKIAREASMGARRAWELELREPLPGHPLEQELGGFALTVVLWEEEREAGLRTLLPTEPPASIALVSGPEGGLSRAEALAIAGPGGVTAGLGGLILRAETAGAYAAMLIRYSYGLLDAAGRGTDA